MRVDAQRNRQELLKAARALFVERGLDVALEAVAQRAGVSIATLYRNFPDRTALVRAVVVDGMRSMRKAAQQASQRLARGATDDTEKVWRDFATTAAAPHTGALMSVLSPMLGELETDAELVEARAESIRAIDHLIVAAQRRGHIRPDIAPAEVMFLIFAIARPLPVLPEQDVPTFAERALHVVLAGLRPDHDSPLPGQPVPTPARRA